MTERILGPTSGGRRRRLAEAVPLMALLALVVTDSWCRCRSPPVPPAINAPTFQIEGNLEDNTGDLGVLDWADGTGGTGVIQANARTSGRRPVRRQTNRFSAPQASLAAGCWCAT